MKKLKPNSEKRTEIEILERNWKIKKKINKNGNKKMKAKILPKPLGCQN